MGSSTRTIKGDTKVLSLLECKMRSKHGFSIPKHFFCRHILFGFVDQWVFRMFLMFSFDSLVNGIVDCYFAVAMVVDYKIANDIKITCKSKNEKFEKKIGL